ncbi:MAG: ATP synthase F1 subunit gamma [Peptococcaceae bacterium]|nr:ATP synthase F1 subunit gamma [Peptococcaceae bacterium]MDH7523715.1 ATP synthase F1 subunit gamma [Peptococcaceae bacterium]
MPGVRDIKRRIRSVKNMQQITKAMEMVSAAKLRRAQAAVAASRPYAVKMEEMLGRIIDSAREKTHPFLTRRTVKAVGFILITADRGLAGGYNANLIRKAVAEAARVGDVEKGFIAVGRKGRDYLRRRGRRISGEFLGINDTPTVPEAKQVAALAAKLFLDGTYDEIHLVYQEFITVAQQKPVIKQLLPLLHDQAEETGPSDYLYEPAPEKVLEMLLPKYVDNQVFQALMEAKAGEHGSRMTAMHAAADNAGEMIDRLILSFNKARQAAITREIMEIVGGADALKAQ